MSHSVTVSIQVVNGPVLADYTTLRVQQDLFGHHVFALDLSFEALGKALGITPDLVHAQAHERLGGKDVTISWQPRYPSPDVADGGTFEFKGFITETSVQADSDLTNSFHISGYSHTFLLESGVQNRAFIKKDIRAIFQQVLADYPGKVLPTVVKPTRADTLPYVAQYQESNYQFLTRLAAQQGEWLTFDGQTLRLGPAPRTPAVRFQSDGMQSFGLAVRLQPGQAEGAHYNYRTHASLHATAATPSPGHPYSQFAVTKSAELFAQPHRLQGGAQLADTGQLQQALDQRAGKAAGRLVTLSGHGEVSGLMPGTVLDVYDAPGSGYGKFRVVAVGHHVSGAGDYSNAFEAIPEALPLPPPHPLAGAPAAASELAEVIDLNDPKHLGRIRVRFQWAVKQPVDAESGWLRVSTPYSGDGKGQMFTPEKGSQVLVGYEQGLAAFPVVLGNLFHPQNPQKAKYSTPNNHLKGLQTAGGNKVVMNDSKGAQTILLSNSNKKSTAITVSFENDGKVHIQSAGPVAVNGSTITLDAGAPGKGSTAFTGEILLRAKNITLQAEEEIKVDSISKNIALTAKTDITADAVGNMMLSAKEKTLAATGKLEISSGATVDISGATVKINE
ncbi:type VI secretion system Vgr family protein [Hymenobacter sp. H14-R3]|uniref:type VI secretion system Vgr family protein n=1 Tax=Hymenobacter sp. H14-R3 TaxID=3046308 RepID=UPI0024BADEE9|nr:type VI secretion system Vgr family protein [Hymenobacter sp. H14-R3]MDJ0367932.1 type VI secretion system Vgr family protein [Hymenobacter sp. H14-R3]